MASRPAPRKSTLTRTHPAAPAAEAQQPVTTTPTAQDRRPAKASAERARMSFHLDAELAGQARAVLVNIPTAQHGYRNISDLLVDALTQRVRQLQAEYNDGQAWPPAHAGDVPSGRPGVG